MPADPDKPSSSKALSYSIDSQSCSPSAIVDLLSAQVGFEVILLDSKCYPILQNSATTEFGFWKSTRKVLAASKVSYEKLTGKTFSNTIDLSSCEGGSPPVKRKCLPDENIEEKMEKVHESVEKLHKNFDFLSSVSKAFECVICKSVCRKPVVASCCQRLVGCETCVSRWLERSTTCPHCSCTLSNRMHLKGFDETLQLASLI